MRRRNKMHPSAVLERIQDQSEKLIEDVRELGHIAVEGTGDVIRGMRKRGVESFEDGRDNLRRRAEEVEGYVGDNPLKSLVLAACAGLLLGLFLRR